MTKNFDFDLSNEFRKFGIGSAVPGQTSRGTQRGHVIDTGKTPRTNVKVHQTNKTQVGHYVLGKTIGKGTFGKVKLALHEFTNENVAIKILDKSKIKELADIERVSREILILKSLRHQHLIHLYEIMETPTHLYLIMDFCNGGELFDYIVKNIRIKEKEAVKFFRQIISGIEEIHRLKIVHRDLKPENLLLDENKNIRLIDFGLSNRYKEGEYLKTACGSPCYAAPEMIQGLSYWPLQCDLWSCGVILFAIVCGYLPFEDGNTNTLYKKIIRGQYEIHPCVGENCKRLIRGLLTTDPSKRFTLKDVKSDPWFNGFINPQTFVKFENFNENLNGPNKCGVFECKRCQKFSNSFDQGVIETTSFLTNNTTEFVLSSLEQNKHNSSTATYYLLIEKQLKENRTFKTSAASSCLSTKTPSSVGRPPVSSRASFNSKEKTEEIFTAPLTCRGQNPTRAMIGKFYDIKKSPFYNNAPLQTERKSFHNHFSNSTATPRKKQQFTARAMNGPSGPSGPKEFKNRLFYHDSKKKMSDLIRDLKSILRYYGVTTWVNGINSFGCLKQSVKFEIEIFTKTPTDEGEKIQNAVKIKKNIGDNEIFCDLAERIISTLKI